MIAVGLYLVATMLLLIAPLVRMHRSRGQAHLPTSPG